jgi:hypothetical protein
MSKLNIHDSWGRGDVEQLRLKRAAREEDRSTALRGSTVHRRPGACIHDERVELCGGLLRKQYIGAIIQYLHACT